MTKWHPVSYFNAHADLGMHTGGKASGGRQLHRTTGGRSLVGDAALNNLIQAVDNEALQSVSSSAADGSGTVAGKYLSLLSVAHRRAKATAHEGEGGQGAGEEVLEDMYALFGTKRDKQRKEKRRRQLDELARVGNEMHDNKGPGAAV